MLNSAKKTIWLFIARILTRRRRFRLAANYYERLTAAFPEDYMVWCWKGWSLRQQGKQKEALLALDQALEIRHDGAYAHVSKGLALLQLKEYRQSAESLNRAFRINPKYRKDLRYLSSLAEATAFAGQKQEALTLLSECERLHPGNADHNLRRGWLLLELGRYSEAEPVLRSTARLIPKNPLVHQYLGIVLEELKRPAEAEEELVNALALDPNDPISRCSRGRVLTELQRFEEAVIEFGESVRLNDAEPQGFAGLWLAHFSLRNWEAALRAAEKLSKMAPQNADGQSFQAFALLGLNRLEEAENAISRAFEIKPECESAFEAMAQLHFFRDEFEKSAAIAISGKVPLGSGVAILRNIAEEHLKNSRFQEARLQLEALRKLDGSVAAEIEDQIRRASASSG